MSQNPEVDATELTRLLQAWQAGDAAALDDLEGFLHSELSRLAAVYMRRERYAHTLQTTGLVNEAFLKLTDADLDITSRGHFFALAARTMRRILVDHARARTRDKRGGVQLQVTLDEARLVDAGNSVELLELNEALEKLALQDKRLSEAVELVYFGGLNYEEAAAALGVSRSTLGEDLKFARSWLLRAMQ